MNTIFDLLVEHCKTETEEDQGQNRYLGSRYKGGTLKRTSFRRNSTVTVEVVPRLTAGLRGTWPNYIKIPKQ